MIGSLRTRVTPQTATTVDDGTGGQTVTWADGTAVPADVRGATTRERMQAGALMSGGGYRITARYASELTSTKRLHVEPDGPTLEVVSVQDPDGRRRWLEIDAVTVQA